MMYVKYIMTVAGFADNFFKKFYKRTIFFFSADIRPSLVKGKSPQTIKRNLEMFELLIYDVCCLKRFFLNAQRKEKSNIGHKRNLAVLSESRRNFLFYFQLKLKITWFKNYLQTKVYNLLVTIVSNLIMKLSCDLQRTCSKGASLLK